MDKLVVMLSGVITAKSRNDDDAVDRLSRKITTAILIVFAVVVSTSTYVGDPIECWSPAHFTDNHAGYANDVCWISDHFYLPTDTLVPRLEDRKKYQQIGYYRWVPIFLMIQALLCYIPCIIWRGMNSRSGIDVKKIVETAQTYHLAPFGPSRQNLMKYLTTQMNRYLRHKREYRTGCFNTIKNCICGCCGFGKKYGNYLILLYIVVKLLYIINAIAQIFILNGFLGHNFSMFGFNVFTEMIQGKDWTVSHRFPRVTMCDFDTRRLGNVHRYTLQCVLAINFFNEKIYLFYWWWLVFLAVVTILSFLQWFIKFLFRRERKGFIQKHLQLQNKVTEKNGSLVNEFIMDYLKQDGVFVIRLVGENTNGIVTTDLICGLFDSYYETQSTPPGETNPKENKDFANV